MELGTPYQFLHYFLSDDLIEIIAQKSIRYSVEIDTSKPFHITATDVRQFLGICILMSIVRTPSVRDHWSDNLGTELIKPSMSLNRFEHIRQTLHFNDNVKQIARGQTGHDRLFKIRPVIKDIRKRFKSTPMEECLSIDEQMCSTKAKSYLKQYATKKPNKWGICSSFYVASRGLLTTLRSIVVKRTTPT